MAKVIGFDDSMKLKCTCRECTAIIEYTPMEVESKTQIDYGGGTDTVYFIKCPNCNKPVYNVKRYK